MLRILWVTTLIAAVMTHQQEPYVQPTEQLVVELFVRDMEQSIAFYRELGFELVRSDGTFAEMVWEENLFFLDSTRTPPEVTRPAANVRVMVPDVDAYWEKAMRLNASIIWPIGDRDYGLRDFAMTDPNGFGIRFATRLDDHAER